MKIKLMESEAGHCIIYAYKFITYDSVKTKIIVGVGSRSRRINQSHCSFSDIVIALVGSSVSEL